VTERRSSFAETLRTVAVLGRVSNLPTIPSNCLAGWLLGGGGEVPKFCWLCAGAVLIYTGGMFLNDAVDADWDRLHRPERPIPAGRISRGSVGLGAVALLAAGWLMLLAAGARAALWGAVLVAAVVVYDLVHKRIALAPLLMAGCRALLYLTAAAAGAGGLTRPAVLGALGIAGYVAGLSFVAQRESTQHRVPRWPVPLLLLPLAVTWADHHPFASPLPMLGAGVLFLLSTGWCLLLLILTTQPNPGRSVAGLLAGIPLVDGLAAAGESWWLLAAFAGLSLAARSSQRLAPAT
jgi:hypothetical protein